MWKEFKEFAFKGNVIDLAVGVIIGGAFSAIITSVVNDLVMPLVGVVMGGINFAELSITVGSAQIMYGNFIQQVVNFFIVAFCIFIAVKGINNARKMAEAKVKKADEAAAQEAPAEPAAPTEAELLAEIRDLLKEKK